MKRGRRHWVFVTNRRILARSCFRFDGTHKTRWPNPTSARFVADLSNWRAVNRRPDGRGRIPYGEVEAYRCPVCDGWHVGHAPIPEWHHTAKERREDLLIEIGVRATAILWRENTVRIRAEVGDTPESRRGRVRRPSSARARAA